MSWNKKQPLILLLLSFWLLGAGAVWAVDTTIKGGRMELLKKGEEVLFEDGVTLNRGGDQLKANRMKTNKKRDKVDARGNVRLFRRMSSTQTFQGFGRKAFYDTTVGKGYLEGGFKRAHVIYKEVVTSTLTRRIDVYAKRIDFLKERQNAEARKNVYGKTKDPDSGDVFEFWSEEADYFGEEKKLVLKGPKRPKVKQTQPTGDTKIITGRVIIYYIEDKRFTAEGEAEGVFTETVEESN